MSPAGRRALASAVALLALVIAGCAEGAGVRSAPPEVIQRDSAGVQIVVSTGPAWGEEERWVVSAEPVLQIGAIEGAEPYLLTDVRSATRLPDGRIVIVEGRTAEVRVYEENGVHLATIGRRGEAPGEFRIGPDVAVLPGDTLMAYDQVAFRKSWFTMDGWFARDLTLSLEGMIANLTETTSAERVHFADGSFFHVGSYVPSNTRAIDSSSGAGVAGYVLAFNSIGVSDVRLSVIPEDGSVGSVIGRFHRSESGVTREPGGGQTSAALRVYNPYLAAARWAASGVRAEIHLAMPAAREIRTLDKAGALRRISRQLIPLEPLLESTIASRLDADRDSASVLGIPGSQITELYDQIVFPDSIPPYSGLEVDSDGRLWALGFRLPESSDDRVFELFDSDGVWLGQVTVPLEIGEILEIGGDYLLTLYEDELEVPFVRVYRIEKS